MPKFKVFFSCAEDPYMEIEAENEDEARELAKQEYDMDDFDAFIINHGDRGYFIPEECFEIE